LVENVTITTQLLKTWMMHKIFPDHQPNSPTFPVSGNPVILNLTVNMDVTSSDWDSGKHDTTVYGWRAAILLQLNHVLARKIAHLQVYNSLLSSWV